MRNVRSRFLIQSGRFCRRRGHCRRANAVIGLRGEIGERRRQIARGAAPRLARQIVSHRLQNSIIKTTRLPVGNARVFGKSAFAEDAGIADGQTRRFDYAVLQAMAHDLARQPWGGAPRDLPPTLANLTPQAYNSVCPSAMPASSAKAA